jgi:hypothetical protein
MSGRRRGYKDFRARLNRLATSLLPSDREDGKYTEGEEDRIHAYVVLAHAEIESFLEVLARNTTDFAKRRSTVDHCEAVMSRLILFKASQDREAPALATTEAIESAYAHYEKLIDRNNGIRSANVLLIFMPLGMTHADFDPLLLSNLDTFARVRGAPAHTAARLRQGASPSSERKAVEDIAEALSAVAQRVRALVSL